MVSKDREGTCVTKDALSQASSPNWHYASARTLTKYRLSESVMEKAVDLFRLDYHADILANSGGELGSNYPSRMVVLSPPRGGAAVDTARLHRLALVARMARCRGRFPVPVILYRGQHICRSSTLSVGAEMYPRHYYHSLFGGGPDGGEPGCRPAEPPAPPSPPDETPSQSQLFDRIRHMDMKLLRLFSVRTIADLMVENKKVKFGVYVSSSEKVDKEERYSSFDLLSLPYPGCEFFQQYCQRGYQADGLRFDWTQSYIDVEVGLPAPLSCQLQIPWPQYRTWDVVELTQNYLRLLLHCLHAGPDGLLIHCISGWDRTPLFISLLRLTLWADGLVHTSLDASQILYLTLAYDWFLFGHNLPDRVAKDEEIMHFAFDFLLHIDSDEYSAARFGGTARLELRRAESDVQLVDGVLLEGLETDASSLHSSCSSAASDGGGTSTLHPPAAATAAPAPAPAPPGNSESWPFIDGAETAAGATGSGGTSLEGSLSELELSSSSSCSSGRRSDRRRRRRPRPAGAGAADASPAAARRADRTPRLLERQGSGSLESLPEQTFWPAPGPAELRPCRSEAGSFSGGAYHEPRAGTSPVSVPTAGRPRHPSCASVGSSWQIIGGCGSAHGSGSNGSVQSGSSQSRGSYQSMGPEFTESTTTLVDESGEQGSELPETRRAARLRSVRSLFLQSYSAAVGLKTGPMSQRAPANSGLSAIVSNLAGRVSILMT